MDDNMKISVVLPVYNCEKYIERSIRSVLKQTYSNWELLVVNDGSKDDTEKIVKKFGELDKRIRLINQINQGVSTARNHGIDEASGDLLMFLDADDWYEVDAFRAVIEYWDDSLEMLLFDYYDVTDRGKRQRKKHFKLDEIKFEDNGKYHIDYLVLTLSRYYSEQIGTQTLIGSPWGRAYKLDYIKSRHIKFPINVFMNEDVIFNIHAVIGMKKVLYISKPFYDYYMNNSSVSTMMYKKDGEKLITNAMNCNAYIKEIFFEKKSVLYKNAYYKYVFEGVKVILWWIAEEKDKKKVKAGRDFCYEQVNEIKKHLCNSFNFSDKILLFLCNMKCFVLVETIVSIRKKIKRLLVKR